MSQRFDDWEGQNLEHHGIPGMHWGTRRYQNKDGSLTRLGLERYGKNGTGRSARKMTKDFNRLDKGYANVAADQRTNARKTAKFARKAHQAERKGNTSKSEKLMAKAKKYGNKAAEGNKQMKAIENLQWRIIGEAAKKGYTTTSKAVTRVGLNKKQRVATAVAGVLGGAIGGGVAGGAAANRGLKVSGQQIKIKKHGTGGTQIVDYRAGKKYEQEERERQAARKRKTYYGRG